MAGKPANAGRRLGAASTARTLTDPTTSTSAKAAEGGALAAEAIGTAAGGAVVGKVVGKIARTKSGRKLMAVIAAFLVMSLLIAAAVVGSAVQAATMITVTAGNNGADPACDTGSAPGLDAEQTANANTILQVVTARQLGVGDAVIAIMTALTESTLHNVDHGDLAGPDSRGLFQQRDSWGSATVRMDPASATGLFLDRLTSPGLRLFEGVGVPTTASINSTSTSRATYQPWRVAQSVQISFSTMGENYRAKYGPAVEIVEALLGRSIRAEARVDDWVAGLSPTDPRPAEASDIDLAPAPTTSPEATDGATDSTAGCPPLVPPDTSTSPGAWGGYQNGQIPVTALCGLSWSPASLLRCDAAAQFERLNAQYRQDTGRNLVVNEAYRTLEKQRCLYYGPCGKTGSAAFPGTSNHGWALAVDLNGTATGTNSYEARKTSTVYRWMASNAARYGFLENVSIREAWHWEYRGEYTG